MWQSSNDSKPNNTTFEKLIYEFLDTTVTKWTDGTMKRNKGALEKHVLPIMGKRQFADIRPMEWMNLLKSIQREKGIIAGQPVKGVMPRSL